MTEERKQELRQLLEEATKEENLEIRYGAEPVSFPVDVYRNYLQECWSSYGVDFLSFSFWTPLTPNIVDETTKLKLLDFIRYELVRFLEEDDISAFHIDSVPAASYLIMDDSTHGLCLGNLQSASVDLYSLIERLLKIAIGKGIDEAVSFFGKCIYPEDAHGVFHMVTLIKGIRLKTEIQVFEGVRLVPLSSPEVPEQFAQYLPDWLSYALMDQANAFDGNALLVVDTPGFSMFREPAPDPTFPLGQPIDELPFQVEVADVKLPGIQEDLFYQALSLVCNSPVQMVSEEWISKPDKSLTLDDGFTGLSMILKPSDDFAEVEEADIEKAKCLYEILETNVESDLESDFGSRLWIATDRWIQSKVSKMHVDKMIDLGIALEALYVTSHRKIGKRLRDHASWYLGKDNEDQAKLNKEFKEIYEWRSKAVHTGELPNKTKKTPFTPQEVKQFIERAQDLCRESIMKILEDGEFPDWNSLILGGEAEQANS